MCISSKEFLHCPLHCLHGSCTASPLFMLGTLSSFSSMPASFWRSLEAECLTNSHSGGAQRIIASSLGDHFSRKLSGPCCFLTRDQVAYCPLCPSHFFFTFFHTSTFLTFDIDALLSSDHKYCSRFFQLFFLFQLSAAQRQQVL